MTIGINTIMKTMVGVEYMVIIHIIQEIKEIIMDIMVITIIIIIITMEIILIIILTVLIIIMTQEEQMEEQMPLTQINQIIMDHQQDIFQMVQDIKTLTQKTILIMMKKKC